MLIRVEGGSWPKKENRNLTVGGTVGRKTDAKFRDQQKKLK